MKPPDVEVLLEMSRELSLACDPHGLILWADERAARLLGARLAGRGGFAQRRSAV